MKKLFLGLGILVALISGCLKSNNNNTVCNFTDSQTVAPANEVDSVQKYLTANSITATQLPSGVFYKINTQGTGQAIANLCSTVEVRYTGKLTNGTVFDSTGTGGTAIFQLGNLIKGWQKALPLISKGGKITLYIPPTLGYGATDARDNNGNIVIPKNSVLIFDIELVNVG
jgi:FKBP-type peptidyl-prolyl cis-trans isomerase FkpA